MGKLTLLVAFEAGHCLLLVALVVVDAFIAVVVELLLQHIDLTFEC